MTRYFAESHHYKLAEKNGISYHTFWNRVYYYNWPPEKAATVPVRRRKTIPAHIKENCKKNCIPISTYKSRVNALGWDEETASTVKVLSKEEIGARGGVKRRRFPIEMWELAKSNGISYNTFYSRIRRGWDIKQAATLSPEVNKPYVKKCST